ncbi:MAG: hypothetical protein K8H88_32290 [Sandaracinaceae bacterium]|nr:hypothetical protein [Sandaracinaceae bacterium]
MYRNEREQLQVERAAVTAQLVALRAAVADAEAEVALKQRERRALRWPTWSRCLELLFGRKRSPEPRVAERPVPPGPAQTAPIEALRAHNIGLHSQLAAAERRIEVLRATLRDLDEELGPLRSGALRRLAQRRRRDVFRAARRLPLLVLMHTAQEVSEQPVLPVPSWRDDAAWAYWWSKHWGAAVRAIPLIVFSILVILGVAIAGLGGD